MIKVSVNKLCSIDRGKGAKAIFSPGIVTTTDEFARELICRDCAKKLEEEKMEKKEEEIKKEEKKKITKEKKYKSTKISKR